MRLKIWCFFALALAVFSNNAHADTLLVGNTLPTGDNSDFAVIDVQYLDQNFTLTTAAQLTGFSLQMTGFGTDPFTLWLTNGTGPGTTLANVLLQKTLIFPNTGGGGVGSALLNVSTDLFLAPGSYHLIESAVQTSVAQGWSVGHTPIFTPFGSVGPLLSTCCAGANSAFPPASTFGTARLVPAAFQISGNPVPEPSTLFSLALGLVAILAVKRQGPQKNLSSAKNKSGAEECLTRRSAGQ